MYLQCYTAQEIAEAVGLTQQAVSVEIETLTNFGNTSDFCQSANFLDDFEKLNCTKLMFHIQPSLNATFVAIPATALSSCGTSASSKVVAIIFHAFLSITFKAELHKINVPHSAITRLAELSAQIYALIFEKLPRAHMAE